MGEKYDSCYDYELRPLRFAPNLELARASTAGSDFPAPRLSEMLAGGPSAIQAATDYSQRPATTIAGAASRATETLQHAGTDPAAQLAAGQQVVAQLTECLGDVQTQTAQSNATFQVLDHAGSLSTSDLAGVARKSARTTRQAVSEHLGPLDVLIDTVLSRAQDSALNAVGAHAEAAVNRIGQFAHASSAGLYNAMFQRGMGDVPEPPGSAA